MSDFNHRHDPLPDFSDDLSTAVQLIFQDIGAELTFCTAFAVMIFTGISNMHICICKCCMPLYTVCWVVCTHTCMPIYLYVYLDTFLFSSMRITGAECDRCHRRWICQPAFLPLAGWLACGQCGLTMHETYATTIWLQIMIISRMSGHLAAHCCLLVICIS